MISNQVLFFCNYPIVQNAGGPVGYYNKCIQDNYPENVELLNNVPLLQKISFFKRVKLHYDRFFVNTEKNKFPHAIVSNIFIKKDIQEYKYLYFHEIFSLYNVLHLLSKDQIVILQSHTPELPSVEALNEGISLDKYKKIQVIEKEAFKRANYVVLPTLECLPIYQALIQKDSKIKTLITGIKPIKNLVKYPLSQNSINILFIGRRNEVKGFDFLINAFKEISDSRKDINLFIAGKGTKIIHDNIFDLGSTETPFDWINSVDFVLSLNKNSYFDLNVVETVSIGTPLIMTTTEGHNFFKNRPGIVDVTYDNFKEFILNSSDFSKEYKIRNREHLSKFYEKELNNSVYRQNLKELCNSIISENS